MSSKHIVFFTPTLEGGGAEKVVVLIAKWLTARGLEVEVVCGEAKGEWLKKLPPSLKVTDLKSKPLLLNYRLRIGQMPLAFPRLIRYLKGLQDAVVISFLNQANITALVARKFAKVNVPIVISERVHLSTEARINPNLLNRTIPFLARLTYPWAEAIVALSKGVAEDVAHVTGLPLYRIKVIYNPVDPEAFVKADEPVDHPWFSNGQPPVILGVGRLSPEKDFPTLIRAFALVRQHRPAKLVILGEGAERAKLEALVQQLGLQEDVALPGFTDNPFKFMKRAAVFVLSSRYEGFGLVIVEALACGCPVVATNCPSGPAEILEGGKWGKLVRVGDVEGLARAIVETLENPPDRGALKQRAMDFHIDRTGEQFLSLLQEVSGA